MSIERVSFTHYVGGRLCSCMIAAGQRDHPGSETTRIHSHFLAETSCVICR